MTGRASSPEHADAPRADWHALPLSELLETVAADAEAGLSAGEAGRRLQEHGPNRLEEAKGRGVLKILLSQFVEPVVLVLIGAAVIAGWVGELEDVIAILAIVVLNGALGFVQELRAERAMAALQAMAAQTARVRRDGNEVTVDADELVTGDLVLLEGGNIVPADMRLVDVATLTVDESSLTGESLATHKTVDDLPDPELPIGDRSNMAFRSTIVASGRGSGVVVATAMQTEIGRIATLLRSETESKTPLQKRLAVFSRNIAIGAIVICGVILALGLLRGEPPVVMFMTALSLAVGAIPEALPAVVTVSLAFGAARMAKRHALVRKLSAVETLGSVTYICTDKTGTLTENRMTVEQVQLAGEEPAAPAALPADDARRTLLLQAMVLNNDASTDTGDGAAGDPTELALLVAAAEAGVDVTAMRHEMERVEELPFSSERARMTTVHRENGGFLVLTKGAPERVLPQCTSQSDGDSETDFDEQAAADAAQAMAAEGLRVLAVGMRRVEALPDDLEELEAGQTFIGLVGLLDPPREDAAESVAAARNAGIEVVMITGDHPDTATAIARRVGIGNGEHGIVSGTKLSSMPQPELEQHVHEVRVYARVAPEDKLRIVSALQTRGEFVAMTGDGVNDAPALRRADIGVAMGKSGTDVAREAAHMVLLDDDFATIVRAVREGRRIYDNIRRFIRYALSTNSGEIWTLLLAPMFGLPLPLLPAQILWMNLITDGLPGIALAAEAAEPDIMQRPPRPTNEGILARGLWQHALWVGLFMAALAIASQAYAFHTDNPRWQSITFTVLTFSQLAHVLAIRSERESTSRLHTNWPLLGAVVITFALQLGMLYLEPMNRIFRTSPLTLVELLACVGISSLVFAAVELEKWVRRRSTAQRA